jgi:hypothetical protein
MRDSSALRHDSADAIRRVRASNSTTTRLEQAHRGWQAVVKRRRGRRRTPRGVSSRAARSDLEEIPAEDDRSPEMTFRRLEPHRFGYLGIVGRNEVGQHQRLDTGFLRDAPGILG